MEKIDNRTRAEHEPRGRNPLLIVNQNEENGQVADENLVSQAWHWIKSHPTNAAHIDINGRRQTLTISTGHGVVLDIIEIPN